MPIHTSQTDANWDRMDVETRETHEVQYPVRAGMWLYLRQHIGPFSFFGREVGGRLFKEPDLSPDLLEQQILVTFHGTPVNPLVLERRVRGNLHIGSIVAQFKERAFHPLQQRCVVSGVKGVKSINKIVGHLIAMCAQCLNGIKVGGIDCLHKVAKVQQARLELVVMPG